MGLERGVGIPPKAARAEFSVRENSSLVCSIWGGGRQPTWTFGSRHPETPVHSEPVFL